jgi:MarR family transcriptional regulator, organic hydroperoxide resistance regulator
MRKTERPVTPRLEPTLDFMRLLWSIENRLQSTSKRMSSSLGITGPQRLALRVVARFPGISPKEVAELLQLHPSTITGVLQRLEEKGLLARERSAKDGRRSHLRVKPAASRFTRRHSGTVEAAVKRALRRMPAASVVRAREVLSEIIDELGAANDD